MQSYETIVQWSAKYLELGYVTIAELREEAQRVKSGTWVLKELDENEYLNNLFYEATPDLFPNVDQFLADAQGMGEEVRQAEAFWNQKAAEMKARHKRGESPFTVEILQALGLQNTGNRLYTLLCAAGQDLRQNQDYWSLSNYLGIWYSRNLVEIYETGNLSAIHNEGIGGGGAGSLAELAKAIETAGNQKRPKFGP
jgi:hypothetical protein